MEGSVDQLKESVLGRVVFDRGSQYGSPYRFDRPRGIAAATSEIAGLLRKNEGRADPVLIAFYSG